MTDRLLPLCFVASVVTGCDRASGAAAAPVLSTATTQIPAAAPADAGTPPVAAESCGGRGEPDCPLRAWMRATLRVYLNGRGADARRLAAALDKLAGAAPVEYPRWGEIARAAATAARGNDLNAVKRACADCHESYRASFTATMRTRRLF